MSAQIYSIEPNVLARDVGSAIAKRIGCAPDDARAVGCQAARLIAKGLPADMVSARALQLARNLQALRTQGPRGRRPPEDAA